MMTITYCYTDYSRMEYVEAIRGLLNGHTTTEAKQLLESFTEGEVQKYASTIEQEIPPSLCRLAHRTLNANKDARIKQFVDISLPEQGSVTKRVKPLPGSQLILGDGRPIKLVLAQSVNELNCFRRWLSHKANLDQEGDAISLPSDQLTAFVKAARTNFNARKRYARAKPIDDLQLLALTEHRAALPLLTFTDSGNVLDSDMQPIDVATQRHLYSLFTTTNENPIKKLHDRITDNTYSATALKEYNMALVFAYDFLASLEGTVAQQLDPEGTSEQELVRGLYEEEIDQPARELCREFLGSSMTPEEFEKRVLSIIKPFADSSGYNCYADQLAYTIYSANGDIPRVCGPQLRNLIEITADKRDLQRMVNDETIPQVALPKALGIEERLEQHLGPYNPQLSQLIKRLGALVSVGDQHSGWLIQEPTSKSDIDVHVSAEITQRIDAYHLRMSLEPKGGGGKKDPLERFDGEIYSTHPNKELDDEEVSELLHLLGALPTQSILKGSAKGRNLIRGRVKKPGRRRSRSKPKNAAKLARDLFEDGLS